MSEGNEVYYRIYLGRNEKLAVVCMQHFDEPDYHAERFYRGEDGHAMRWEDEGEALKYLNENFKAEFIDPEFLSPNNDLFRLMKKSQITT